MDSLKVIYSYILLTNGCADAAKVVSAFANVSWLQLEMRISKQNLRRTDTEDLYVRSLCVPTPDEMLLASRAGLRALSLHNAQLAAHEPTAIQDVERVAFDAHTDTLLLLVLPPNVLPPNANNYQLVSLRRNASEWLEVHRLNTSFEYISGPGVMEVCDSRVLLGESGGNTLYIFNVSAAHTLRAADSLSLQNTTFRKVACARRDGDTLVAFSHSSSVSLQRLASLPLRLERLASVDFTDPHRLLFRGDLLFVTDWNSTSDTHVIVSLRASGNAFTERRVLLDAQPGVGLGPWALSGDRLVLWDSNSEDLLVYTFA